MSSGTFGKKMLPAGVLYTLYETPAIKVNTVNLNMVNTGTTTSKVRFAIGATNPPTGDDWIEYDCVLLPAGDPANGNVLERTAIAVEAGQLVVVYAQNEGVVGRAHGYES